MVIVSDPTRITVGSKLKSKTFSLRKKENEISKKAETK